MPDYVEATKEIYNLLDNTWHDQENGAQAVGNLAYIPAMHFMYGAASDYSPPKGAIWARAGYQTVIDGSSIRRSPEDKTPYMAVGRLGIHIFCPKSLDTDYEAGLRLAMLIQSGFRNAAGGNVQYEDEKIIEVGAYGSYNQINVFVTCRYESTEPFSFRKS